MFHTGMVIRKTGTDDYYVCIGFFGKLLVLLWKVLPMKLARGRFLAFAVGTGININTHPVWVSALELDDYEALPTTVVSPLHLYLQNGKRVHPEAGIVFLQHGAEMPIIVWAAKNCFWSMNKT